MTSGPAPFCQICGAQLAGRFCSNCGASREDSTCTGCGKPMAPTARFCSSCGSPAGAGLAGARDRIPWVIAGVALAGLLAVILIMVAREQPDASAPTTVAALDPSPGAGPPPDISSMTPRERFNRLYNRVMSAAQAGDEATVSKFTPMALLAYAQLDTVDADARYHAALLHVHTGEPGASRALADSILAVDPGHLFGYVVRGTVARFQKDEKNLGRAYAAFLQHYDGEMKRARAEYQEHRTSLEDFRKAALAGAAPADRGS